MRRQGDDGERDELDCRPQASESEGNQEQPSHDCRNGKSGDPVGLHDAVDNHYESPGRAANLHPGPSQRGDQPAGDDGGVKAALRSHSTGDRERDGQRKCHDSHDDTGSEIRHELIAGVGPERGDQLRDKQSWDLLGQFGSFDAPSSGHYVSRNSFGWLPGGLRDWPRSCLLRS